jgi:MFS family permease
MLETFVVNSAIWAVAKLLAGVGVGAIQSTLPIYITEWAPVNIRGAMILAYGIWNSESSWRQCRVFRLTLQTLEDSSLLSC